MAKSFEMVVKEAVQHMHGEFTVYDVLEEVDHYLSRFLTVRRLSQILSRMARQGNLQVVEIYRYDGMEVRVYRRAGG